jgi:hypothetical protein
MGTPSTLAAVRVSGQAGLADVAIEVRQPGFAFDSAGFSLSSCASIDGGNNWLQAGVSETKARETGVARALVVLPKGMLVDSTFWLPLQIAIASPDGKYRGYGGFNAISKVWAAVIAVVTVLLLLWWLLTLRGEELMEHRHVRKADSGRLYAGLFIGPDNEPSLSLFQIFIWTTITVWGFIYVYLVSGSLLAMTTEMMGLLGIAGVGTLAARWVATSRGSTTTPGAAATVATTNASTDFAFWKILSTNGTFDLLKLQLFLFTVTIATYVVYRILDTAAFPALDTNTLLLLGVSQGVYVGGKIASTTPLATAQALKLQLDVSSETLRNLDAALKALQKEKADIDAAGANAEPEQADRLKVLPGLIIAKQQEADAAKAKVNTTKADYDKAVKEVFPAP